MKKILLLAVIALTCAGDISSQNVFDPADPVVRYNSTAAYGTAQRPDTSLAGLQKWVANATNGVSSGSGAFDNSSFKPYFINFAGTKIAFRLKFPRSYTNTDSISKKYPLMLFMHGAGEVGCASNGGLYNNEKQLVHGGRLFMDRVDNNQFDGFLLYPQLNSADGSCWGEWGGLPSAKYNTLITLIDSLVKYARTDIDRIFVDGLSGGGAATWRLAEGYPTRIAKIAPTSAAGIPMNFAAFVHIPVWLATGGKDTNPSPAMALYSETKFTEVGGSMRRSLYQDLGHSSWYRHWQEPDFIPYMNDVHKANPLIFFNRFEFCPDSGVNVKIGITAGFYAYEWERDGELIATRTGTINTIVRPEYVFSFTGNDITVKDFGTYRVRFRRVNNGQWSAWSPKPAIIKPKSVTQTPPIQIAGIRSRVLPSLDGKSTVTLQLPVGFVNYQWVRTSDNVLVSTNQIYEAGPGTYKARYAEQFGCGTLFSPEFKVVSANGSPKPDAAKNLSVSTISQSSLRLDWSENPNAGTNESGFEIYRATSPGGPYSLIFITASDVTSFSDVSLIPNTTYYYIIRAISETGAAAPSNEASAKTDVDNVAPSAPQDLEYRGSTTTTVNLRWKASTDNAGIGRYDIYANGIKMYSTTSLSFTVGNLDSLASYTFFVRAVDKAGNVSQNSNQVIAFTHRQGLNYKYFNGSYVNLPDYNSLTPVKSGVTDTVTAGIGIRTQDDNFAILWQARIYIPVSATYTFETYSDDGSKLYIDVPYSFSAVPLVNNDGSHAARSRTGSIYLTQGYHSITIAYAEVVGNQEMSLFWSNNVGLGRERIPKNFLSLDEHAFGSAVNAPGIFYATALSYNKVQLTWTDNSTNESAFELVRSTSINGTFENIATTLPNATTFTDSGLSPATTYYYKIRAVGNSGESAYSSALTEGNWRFNSNFNESGGGLSLLPTGTSFSSTDKAEGSHAVVFASGNSISFNGGSSAFPSAGGYNQRTMALWIKPTATNNKRIVFELGGSDNGIALKFHNGDLIAGIASGSSRHTAALSSFATSTNWQTNQWNHVAVVYDLNTILLYLNGVQVASNTTLPFTTVGSSTNASRIGNPSGTGTSNTVFNDNAYTGYQGLMDNLLIIRGALGAAEINLIRSDGFTPSMARTLAAPVPPATPLNVAANVISTNSIQLTWNDVSDNETGFEIWRSSGDKSNDRRIARVSAGPNTQQSFTDTSLFANVTYYYRVRATGEVSTSAFSQEVSAKTLNTNPMLKKIVNFTMKYGTTYSLAVTASDTDGDAITFSYTNLPTFATIQEVSNGNINIVFSPPVTRRGSFPITVRVIDGNGGVDSSYFTLTVNTNDVPVLGPVADAVIDEGRSVNVSLSATDNNGTANMIWSFEGLPSFATFVNNNNGTGNIEFKPGYSSSGEYSIVIIVNDGLGAWISTTMKLTVNDKDPEETLQFNFRSQSASVPLWNNVNIVPPSFSHGTIVNTKNNLSSVGLALVSGSVNASLLGPQTGNNSGVYPDLVMKDLMTWGFSMGTNRNDTIIVKVNGLDIARRYNFIFFAGYNLNGVSTSQTKYLIGNDTAAVNYYQNTRMTDTIYAVAPNAAGEVLITMIGDPNINRGGVLNALLVKSIFDDGSTPAKPARLSGSHELNTGVRLNWEDRSFNEIGYKIYRSGDRYSGYQIINDDGNNKDSITYLDVNIAPESIYYYYVVGYNGAGDGQSSDTVRVATGNNKPVIALSDAIYVKEGTTTNVDFSVTDDAGDVVSVSIEKHPAFVQLQNAGGSMYRLEIIPTKDNIGWFAATIKASDQKGAVSVKQVMIAVNDKNTRSVFINYGSAGKNAPEPWNNFTGIRTANTVLSNLKDETNIPTPFSITMVSSWAAVSNLGHMTGKNNGVAPDSVLESGIADGGGPKSIRFGGLNNAKKYNIMIIGSQNEGTNAAVEYSAGTIKDTLNAKYNMHQSANLNGLSPVDGQITFSALRLTGTATSLLNGVVLEEYEPSIAILNPAHLYAEAAGRNVIDISWIDRTLDEDINQGYYLERSKDSLFSEDLSIIALPGNTTSYRDANLSSNTVYWYRVRARTGANAYSEYSNRAKAITPASTVYMNFNYTLPDADFPWNNTFTAPSLETTFDNLINHNGAISGMSMSITKIFNGEFTAGVNTGNNSGVVPDKALVSNYWIDNTQQSQIRISGLNHSRRYRVGFFGSSSSVGWFKGNYTATYTVNGTTVYLNSWMNSSKVVYIDDLVPDENGDLVLDFSTTQAAAYGFNGGIIVEDYSGAASAISFQADSSVLESTTSGESADLANSRRVELTQAIKVYPNPFAEVVSIEFENESHNDRISVEVYDLTGRMMHRKIVGQLPKGSQVVRLTSGEAKLSSGMYIVTLSLNGRVKQASKMIRLSEK
jgi:large repetitive protein